MAEGLFQKQKRPLFFGYQPMHADVRSSLFSAVKDSLAALNKPISIEMSEPHLVYKRTAPGHWQTYRRVSAEHCISL